MPLAPAFVSTEGGVTYLLIGPSVCTRLQPGQFFDIIVVEGGNEHEFESVIWQGSRALTNPFVPKKGPSQVNLGGSKPVPAPGSVGALDDLINTLDTRPNEKPGAKSKASKLPLVLSAATVAVVVLAAGTTLYLQTVAGCTLMPFSCPATEDEPSVAPSDPASASQFMLATASGGNVEQWRSLIADANTPTEELIALGQWLWTEPEDPQRFDTGYDALYTAAMERNSPEAQMIIATEADPLLSEADADSGHARTALTFYSMAAAAGNGEAGERLAALCDWAAQQQSAIASDLREARDNYCS